MPAPRIFSTLRLVNGSIGDPVLYVDYPGRDDALLFDAGDNGRLSLEQLADLDAVFVTHHHMDHFIGLDRILRAVIDRDKTVSLYGPAGTIAKVYDRIKAYEFQHFPFQKLVFEVHEIHADVVRSARLECQRRFPEPEVVDRPWPGGVVYENACVKVEAGHVDHTVPCVNYAFVEKAGWHVDGGKLGRSVLRWGPWVSDVTERLRSEDEPSGTIRIEGGTFKIAELAERFFRRSSGARIAFITDTAWSEAAQPVLRKLAHRANRLYCDGFYLEKHAKNAEKHRHMTAHRAATLAVEAEVRELVLMHFSKRYAGNYGVLVDEARETFDNARAELDVH